MEMEKTCCVTGHREIPAGQETRTPMDAARPVPENRGRPFPAAGRAQRDQTKGAPGRKPGRPGNGRIKRFLLKKRESAAEACSAQRPQSRPSRGTAYSKNSCRASQ